jgi:hypothetical protein
MLESVKRHPYLLGGGVIAAIGIYLLISSGGSGAATGGTSAADASIYATQAAASTETQRLNLESAAQQNTLAAQIEGMKISGANQISLADIAAQLGLADINAKQEVTDTANTSKVRPILRKSRAIPRLAPRPIIHRR